MTKCWPGRFLLSEVVEDHDVCIHVEEVVAVGGVVICGPLFRFWAPKGEHVVTVFGFIVHTVKAWNLRTLTRVVILSLGWFFEAQQDVVFFVIMPLYYLIIQTRKN